jgi:ubiquinone/menaquinone biosynthesis C-methylase UbiE
MAEPHVERIRAQFTRQADVYARMRQTTDQKGLDGLVKLSGAEATHRVLDVACGPGFLTMTFAARTAHATGFDATDAFLALARAEAERRGLGNVEFRSGDAASLPFADASFDVVSCRAAFHHFPRPARILAEMRRVARPGASLVIADMLGSEDPAKAAYHDRMERLCDPTHVRALPETELRRLFTEAGLVVRFAGKSPLDIEVQEWIAHGGPNESVARELYALVEASLETDLSGLHVRREGDRLLFSHQGGAFLLSRPA